MNTEEMKTHWTPDELVQLRQMFQQTQLALGLSQAAAARDADVASSTISQFLTDTYTGDVHKVARKVANWVRTKREEIELASTAPPEPPFVRTQIADQVIAVLRAAHALSDIGVVAGPAGCGKTTAARHYQGTAARVAIVTGSPSIATASAIMQRLIAARGEIPRGRTAASKLELTTHVRRIYTAGGLIIVDEAQHLNMEALEELRAVHDETGVGIVLMGNETVLSRIQGEQRNAAFAQLYSRAGVRVTLKGADPADIDLVIATMGVAAPGPNQVARSIGAKESLRSVVKTTRRALMIAAAEKRDLEADDLRLAFRHLGGTLAR